MSYTIEYPNKQTAVISISLDKDAWTNLLDKAKAHLGDADVNQAREFAISTEAGQVLAEAVTKEGLKLAAQPLLTAVDNEDGSVTITLTCTLLPEVNLTKYTGFQVAKPEFTVAEDEVVEEVSRRIAASQIWTELPAGTPAEKGDQVVIDFVGEKDGVPFDGGSAKEYPLVLGSGSFIPGFEDQLIGLTAGESKAVNVTFPQDYFEPSLAGAPVVFQVKVLKVEKLEKPELNDTFIEKMNLSGVKTVQQLTDAVRADLIGVREQEAQDRWAQEILEKLIETNPVELPESMIASHVDQLVQEYEGNLKQYGLTLDEYLKGSNQTLEQFREKIEPSAVNQIHASLLLEAVAEKEQIKVNEQELEDEYKLLSAVYQFPVEQLKMLIPQPNVEHQIIQNKTIQFLKDHND
jgi:trigger factor